MESTTLQQFIETRVRAGAGREAIREQLLAVGWSEDECDKAYAAALVASGVPVPTEGMRGQYIKRASTLDVVLNFFSFILLGITSTALGTLYFQIINKYFPDTLARAQDYYDPSYGGMDTDAVYYAIAALVVAFPIYYFVVRAWFRRFREDEGKIESKLTKWLTYLVLLAASVTIVGDLIVTIFTFLQGEITMRFFLKALTILVIAGMIFGFYFLERKKVQYRTDVPRRIFLQFGYVLSGVVLVGVVLGFVAAGSPAMERNRTFDARRAQDLSDLAGCLQGHAQQFERLPESLEDLGSSSNFSYCTIRDPETNALYEYTVLAPLASVSGTGVLEGSVELCAVFALPATNADQAYTYSYSDSKWYEHAAGRDCDRETVSVKPNPFTLPPTAVAR